MRVACCVGEAAAATREADSAEAAEAAKQGAWAARETEVTGWLAELEAWATAPVDAEVVESEVASTPEEVPPDSRGRGLDVRAPPFYPSVAHASVAQAVGAFRAELQAWMALRAVPVTWPTRSGGWTATCPF